jgi:hypothetical protein
MEYLGIYLYKEGRIVMKARGRPTKYTKDRLDSAYEILAVGSTNAVVCKELYITKQTFYR